MNSSFMLNPSEGATHRTKRVGRGTGSGRGSTACRGHDGQRSRSGKKRPYVAFEGGQMPLYRRVPKRGFFHPKRKAIVFNLSDLNRLEANSTLNQAYLLDNKIIKNPQTALYILGKGELKNKINVEVHRISANAKEKIEALGGSVTVVEG